METSLGSVASTTTNHTIYEPLRQKVSDSWRSALAFEPKAHGFIQSHISPRKPKIQIFANLTKIKVETRIQRGGGVRGQIKGFSNASRKRMIEFLNMIRNFKKVVFITLTYPAEWEHDPERWKRDIDTFFKRLYRLSKKAFAIWRIEPQGRGAPHYHILLVGRPSTLNRFRKWVSLAWYQIVGSGSFDHYLAGTQVKRVYNRQHAMYYISKYAAKPEQEGYHFIDENGVIMTIIGKHWGIHNRAEADTSPFAEYTLTPLEMVELRRMMVRYLKSRKSRYAKKLARAHPKVGWAIFGLGDVVKGQHRTIMRMLTQVFDEEFVWTAI